jgi:hypothetical protein
MTKHPIVRDRLRTYLAQRSLIALVCQYILLTGLISLLIAVAWLFPIHAASSAQEFLWKWWYAFVFIYGYQPAPPDEFLGASYVLTTILSVLSVVLPTLILGAVIFKIFVPHQKLLIYRNHLALVRDNEGDYLYIYFYIASQLRFVNLDIAVYARTLLKRFTHQFPLHTYRVDTEYSYISLPYSLVPSRIVVPVTIKQGGRSEHTSGDRQLVFNYQDGRLQIEKVCDVDIIPQDGDQVELDLIISADIPDLNIKFGEHHRYILPDAARFGESRRNRRYSATSQQIIVMDTVSWSVSVRLSLSVTTRVTG